MWNNNPLSLGTWIDLPEQNLVVGYLDLTETVHDFYHTDPTVNFMILEYGLAPWGSYGTLSSARGAPIFAVSRWGHMYSPNTISLSSS